MLTGIHRVVLIATGAITVVLMAPIAAYAGGQVGGVQCAKNDPSPVCNVNAGTGSQSGSHHGGTGGGGGGSAGDGKCHDPSGQDIPCQRDGGVAGPDGCYYQPTDPRPEDIAAIGGQPTGPGGWYMRVCYGADGTAQTGFGGAVWVAGNAPPVISPAVLARQARKSLRLPAVVIDMNPPGDQLVNLPVWLALDPASWKPQSATASVPGVSVTATARPMQVAWSMGDGSTRTCDGPGTAWTLGTDPRAQSPDCGYRYTHSSADAPGGTYTVTAMITWQVTWAGAGQTGTVPGLETTGLIRTQVQIDPSVISQ